MKRIIPVAAMLTIVGILSGCSGIRERMSVLRDAGPEAAAEAEAEATEYAVRTIVADSGSIIDYLDLNGDIAAETQIDSFADTTGKLSSVLVDVGDTVAKDEVIAEVDPSRPGMIFALSPVKAPISGTVLSVSGRIGATVSPQFPIVRIGELSNLVVEVAVPERFVSKVFIGMRGYITLHSYPDVQYRALVTEISPVIDPMTRTMQVKLTFDNFDSRVKAGMYSSIKLITDVQNNAVRLPVQCIVTRFGEDFVFVLNDEGSVDRRPVVMGIKVDGMVEIKEGVQVGDHVVAAGLSLLEDGALVREVGVLNALPASNL